MHYTGQATNIMTLVNCFNSGAKVLLFCGISKFYHAYFALLWQIKRFCVVFHAYLAYFIPM